MREGRLAGELYIVDGPELADQSSRALDLMGTDSSTSVRASGSAAGDRAAGVSIGTNTVVGAGAVVTRDLPADVIAVSSSARTLRRNLRRHGR